MSQPLILPLKLAQAGLQPQLVQYEAETAQKTYDKSVTCEIFHKLIGPYVAAAAVGLAHQASRATSRAARLGKKFGGGGAGARPGGYGGSGGDGGAAAAAVSARPRSSACLLYTSPSPRD